MPERHPLEQRRVRRSAQDLVNVQGEFVTGVRDRSAVYEVRAGSDSIELVRKLSLNCWGRRPLTCRDGDRAPTTPGRRRGLVHCPRALWGERRTACDRLG
jgi:hypothetical protein